MRPKLSIVLPTLNAQKDLMRFFVWFNKQSISKKHIELLIMDGGSTDKTRHIAKINGARVIHNPYRLTEPGVALGFRRARADLVMILAADNIFPDPKALEKIIGVFKDKKIIAAFPKHDTGPRDNLYSRYINTFTDPFTHFVYLDAANTRTFKRLYKTLVHNSTYDVYDYTSYPVRPIVALAQAFTIRKKFLPKRKEISDDILSVYRLMDEGRRMAYVHSVTLWHYTIRDTRQFISKLKRGVDNALLRKDSGITKRKNMLTRVQKIRMVAFFPYAFTIILPLLQSIINAFLEREIMWLMHLPLVLFSAIVIVYHALGILLKRLA
jgi:glycosyltransferase involved in cell wall biosynthesis